jgi:hypothetical protein
MKQHEAAGSIPDLFSILHFVIEMDQRKIRQAEFACRVIPGPLREVLIKQFGRVMRTDCSPIIR